MLKCFLNLKISFRSVVAMAVFFSWGNMVWFKSFYIRVDKKVLNSILTAAKRIQPAASDTLSILTSPGDLVRLMKFQIKYRVIN